GEGTMKTHTTWKRYLVAWKALAIAVVAGYASSVAAQLGYENYTPPAAHVVVASGPDIAYDFDGLIDGELQTLLPRIALASLVGASAYGESTKNHYAVKAITSGTKNVLAGSRSANAYAHYIFIPHDSQ